MFQCLNIKRNMLEHLVNVLCGKHKCSSKYTRRFGYQISLLSFQEFCFPIHSALFPAQIYAKPHHHSLICHHYAILPESQPPNFEHLVHFCFLALCAFFFCNSSFSVVLVPNARAYCLSLSLLLIQLVVSVHLVQSHQLSSVFHTYFSYSFFLKCCSENSVWSYFYST